MSTRIRVTDREAHKQQQGVGQLSLVEHALCPLSAGHSLRGPLVHECQYAYSDPHGRRHQAHVRVTCPLGLSAQDEYYLWGLLALTFSQPEPDIEFHATPHYCLRQLGIINQHAQRGGRQYRQFAAALERLSVIHYQNDAFYDALRAEHRRVSFGLFSYSLPLDPQSSRTWRIVWDPLLFELVSATGGHLWFDLQLYRTLDPATRRLFLLLTKVFRRRARAWAPRFDLHELAVHVLGFASTVAIRDLKVKVARCVRKLVDLEIVQPSKTKDAFDRARDGRVTLRLRRGRYFDDSGQSGAQNTRMDSPLAEPLREIGLDSQAISRILTQYPLRLVQQWLDITLAAKERLGPDFFRRSPAAYFVDNVKHAAAGNRTPPDWWWELRRAEQRVRKRPAKPATHKAKLAVGASPIQELTAAFEEPLVAAGQPADVARKNATRLAEQYCQQADPTETGTDPVIRLLQLLQ